MQHEKKGDVQLDFRNPAQHTGFETPKPTAEFNGGKMIWKMKCPTIHQKQARLPLVGLQRKQLPSQVVYSITI